MSLGGKYVFATLVLPMCILISCSSVLCVLMALGMFMFVKVMSSLISDFYISRSRPGFLIKGITIYDLQEIGFFFVVKHRFTMCCRIATIACKYPCVCSLSVRMVV